MSATMNKNQLITEISALLDKAIEIHELVDLKLEEQDHGVLEDVHIHLNSVVTNLREVRRKARLVLEEYEDDLTKKPEYLDKSIDEDADEDEDEEEDEE